MPAKYTDAEIARMLAERKVLPPNYPAITRLRDKRGHQEQELDVRGESGSEYRLIIRQSTINRLDFSVILAVKPTGSNQLFRLKRYNGKSHEHTNALEDETFYDFHVHQATERYQNSGGREDGYAEASRAYAELHEALQCLFSECGFEFPPGAQYGLFGGFAL